MAYNCFLMFVKWRQNLKSYTSRCCTEEMFFHIILIQHRRTELVLHIKYKIWNKLCISNFVVNYENTCVSETTKLGAIKVLKQ